MYLYFYSSFKCSHLQFALQREPECEYVEFADSCYNIYQIWYFFEYNIITTPTKEKNIRHDITIQQKWCRNKTTFRVMSKMDCESTTQKTRDVGPMSIRCWSSVFDAGPTTNRHRANVSCLLGIELVEMVGNSWPSASHVFPADTRRRPNAGLTLAHRLRRCPALNQHRVSAWCFPGSHTHITWGVIHACDKSLH